MFASEKHGADFVRANLFSTWAHDCHGLLWWCAFGQSHLEHAPYDWIMAERELGLFREDGTPRPALGEIGRFRKFLDRLPFDALPPRIVDGVCILSAGQDHWGVAYSTHLLATQAGISIEFQDETQTIKKAPFYLLPSVTGSRVISRRRWLELLGRVREGAVLYLSHQDAILSSFEEVTGLEVQTRQRESTPSEIHLEGVDNDLRIQTANPVRLTLRPTRARVLGRESNGNPAFTCADYGKGRVYFLVCPIEMELTRQPGAFHAVDRPPYWKIYQFVAQPCIKRRVVFKTSPQVGVTEHPFDSKNRLVIMINYAPAPVAMPFTLRAGWRIKKVFYGGPPCKDNESFVCKMGPNDALVFGVTWGASR